MTLTHFFQHLANGVYLGSLYALIAIGYTMVYGILRLINFAHGELLIVGAFIAYYGILIFHLPWWFSFIIAIALGALVGMSLERVAYRPLRERGAPRISLLVSAIGASFFLQNLGLVIIGGRHKSFYRPPFFAQTVQLGDVTVMNFLFVLPIITIIILGIVFFLVYRSKTGMAMRALAKDYPTARLMGININRIIAYTFALGSALAAIGGIMYALRYPAIHPLAGVLPGLKCFIAAVVGGIGNVPGAVLGGFLLGMLEIMGIAFFPHLAGYRDAIAFIVLIIILSFKPTGLLGEQVVEKV